MTPTYVVAFLLEPVERLLRPVCAVSGGCLGLVKLRIRTAPPSDLGFGERDV